MNFSFILYSGALMPPLIAMILGRHWPTALKTVVSFLVCMLASVIVTYQGGRFDVSNYSQTLTYVMGGTGLFFLTFWRPVGLAQLIEEQVFPAGLVPFVNFVLDNFMRGLQHQFRMNIPVPAAHAPVLAVATAIPDAAAIPDVAATTAAADVADAEFPDFPDFPDDDGTPSE